MNEKNVGGAPPHEPDEEKRAKIIAFACAGYTHSQIANYFDIDEKTLRKYYRYELDQAKMEKIGKLSDSVYKKALEGDDKMLEFVLKCQGRWSYAKPPEDAERDKKVESLMEKLIDKL